LTQRDWFLRLLYDSFKPRIAAQRIPERQQFQLAIADIGRTADESGELVTGQIFVTSPGSDHGEILDHDYTKQCVLFHRHQLDCAAAFL
jgi:hypothetical protein